MFSIRHLLLRFIYLVRGENVFNNIHELKCLEKITPYALQHYHEIKIGELLTHVTAKSAFYRKLLATTAQRDLKLQFDELPLVDKHVLIDNMDSLIDKDFKQSFRSTSGTTGSPFRFCKDVYATGYMDAMMYIAYSWHGIEKVDRQARLWGQAIKTKDMYIQKTKDMIMNRKRLNVFEMTENRCFEYFKKLQRFKPKYFYSYSNALYQFAAYLEKSNLDGKTLGVDIAICTGEVLFLHQREKIAEIFGCKVVNEYGSTENGIIGFECEYGKMHVMPTVIVEIDNPDENGLGQIVVTELNSRSIPFIKYKNGDIGKIIKDTCECKRPYQVIEINEGRIDDYIKCPDGRLVYDAILAYTLKDYAVQFKAYQEKLDCIKIYIVPNNSYNIASDTKLKNILRKYLGDGMVVEIYQVEILPHEQSGKFRYFVSSINKNTPVAVN